MASGSVVEARDLAKSYGSVQALDAVSFDVWEGEIFGLIGADGAGKTTAFRIIGGVLVPGSGAIRVLGTAARKARPSVGYLTQPFSLYQDLSIAENLKYAAGLREVSPEDFATRSERYCKMFDLTRFMGRLAGRLSGGMKQKLALSCALISDPKLLLLDEPTTGVDPVTRRDFWDALTSLATGGMTIVVATPYLDEAERCHRVAVMERGKIYEIDSPADFRSKLGLTRLEVHAEPLKDAEEAFAGSPAVRDVQRFGDRLDVSPLFEEQIVKSGILLFKYWLEVSNEEQERRFAARIHDPLRQWKLSPIDLPSRTRWYDYSRARDLMLKATDTQLVPWYITRSDNKKRARLNCISHLLSLIPYERIPRGKVKLPKRSTKGAYDDQSTLKGRRFIPEKY